MEAAFWNGFVLENFMFNHVSIKSYPEFIGICFITAAIAVTFEGCRTVRDWLYLKFLKKRSCNQTSSDTPIILRNFKSLSPKNEGNGTTSVSHNGESVNNGKSEFQEKANGAAEPVIATGTIRGLGENCSKPNISVGFLELLFSTLLHMCQVILGYILMLMVMTFNVWIFLAVLVGTSIGFFVFDAFNKKIHALKANANPKK